MTLTVGAFQQTSSYTMESFRNAYKLAGGAQIGTTSLWTITAPGSMTVTVSAGDALVNASGLGGKGYYHIENDADVPLTVTPAHATLPRIDAVILTAQDSALGGASDSASLSIVAGTPQSGATLNNLLGSPSVPGASALLAYLLVPAAAVGITTASHIRLAQYFTRGAMRIGNAAGDVHAANFAANPVTPTQANTKIINSMVRVQSNGNPLKVQYSGQAWLASIGTGTNFPMGSAFVPMYSSDATSAITGTWAAMETRSGFMHLLNSIGAPEGFCYEVDWIPPAAGNYLIGAGLYVLGAQGTSPFTDLYLVGATSGEEVAIAVEEMLQDYQTLRNN